MIAERVYELRRAAGLNQEQLAKKVAERGVPWKRSTVVNLEARAPDSRGKSAGRDAVTVQELFALALALDVPPVLLLADPRHVGTVPIAARIEVDAWTALLWAAGHGSLNDQPGSGLRNATELLRDGYQTVDLLAELGEIARSTNVSQDLNDSVAHALLRTLAATLARIEEAGAPLPRIPGHVYDRATALGIELPGTED